MASLAGVHLARRVQFSNVQERQRGELRLSERSEPTEPTEATPSLHSASSLHPSRSHRHASAIERRSPLRTLAMLLPAITAKTGFNPTGVSSSSAVSTAPIFNRRIPEVLAKGGGWSMTKGYTDSKDVSTLLTPAQLDERQNKKKKIRQEVKVPTANMTVKKLVMPNITKSKIRAGDYVVHSTYGVGQFMGVFKSAVTDSDTIKTSSSVKVKYRDGVLELQAKQARQEIRLFKRNEETKEFGASVRLDSMKNSKTWDKRKKKAAQKVWTVAADLMKMYAQRELRARKPCPPDDWRMEDFAATFPHTPTPDQQRTFQEVEHDMTQRTQPMDRLVCGDVGFGKTEVAMRAMYRMTCTGRQVGLLAPTTVLAAQHYRTVQARMPDKRVELLATIVKRKPKEKARLLLDIEVGKVDIIIGTHSLISSKVKFHNIGLLIVDEEQRFGVRQKEKVKNMTTTIDVLTLTATPIPRTMYMCMAGIREMSKLSTPPSGRLPIITKVGERNNQMVFQAIRDEVARGGQVFYVVPRIEMLHPEVILLREFLPEITIQFAHAGLKDLEERIVSFTLGEQNILVATTIMENGIDIPNVNTIVIQEANYFGLAQLHQLRGRVGRCEKQAYAYLMHPASSLSEDAETRLNAMASETSLGCGETLSRIDLENRGSGNIFGEAQKGNSGMSDIGVEMYMEVLQKVMKYLEKKRQMGLPDDPALDAELFQQSMDDMMLLNVDESLS